MAGESSPSYNIRDAPAGAPPPGVVPDFIQPASRSYQVIAASAILSTVVIVSALIRIYAKFFITKTRIWEDYAAIAGTIAVLAFTGVATYESASGVYGRHEYEIMVGQFTNSIAETALVTDVFYTPVIWLVKLSLSLLILHIFARLRWIRYAIWFTIVWTFLYYFGALTYFLVVCSPRSGETYAESVLSRRCRVSTTTDFIICHGVVNVFSDLYLFIIPIPAVWSLQLPRRKKLGVIAMFMVGLLACTASAIGIVFRVGLQSQLNDYTWYYISVILTMIFETNLGIVTGSMPAFAIVMRHHSSSASSYLSAWIAKVGSIIPDSSRRGNRFSRTAPRYRENDERSDSYIELQHGIKVQHEITVTQDRDSIGTLPQVRDYFGDNAIKAQVRKE